MGRAEVDWQRNADNKNLYVENDLASGVLGKAISQQLPFWWQIGARLTF